MGRATVTALAEAGARVMAAARRQERLRELAEELTAAGRTVRACVCDVTQPEVVERLIETTLAEFGKIDILVNVAGNLRERMFFNMSEDEWDAVVDVHLKGTFTCFRAAAPIFKEQKSGTFIGFTSGAFAGSVAQANYASAKAGIVTLTRSVAAGMHRYGVTANVIAPVAKTRMSANVPFEIANMGEPEDIAPMVSTTGVAVVTGRYSRHRAMTPRSWRMAAPSK